MKHTRFLVGNAPTGNGLAQALIRSNLSIPALRALSPLSEDAQRVVDQAVIRVGLDRLTIFADILAAGLTFPITDPLSVTEVQWEYVTETGGAQRTMLPQARGEYELPDRTFTRIPVYLTTDDFSLNIRTLRMSERIGQPLDTTLVEQATRRVNEALEDALINGAGVQVGGYSTPGLLDAPNANYIAYTGGESWAVAGHTGEEIYADVESMISAAIAAKRYGPYTLYVPTNYGTKLNQDYKSATSGTILQRLQEINVGGQNLVVKSADMLPADKTILLQLTSDVVDIIDGQRPTTIPWTSIDGFTLYWMVMAIMVPRVKTDGNATSGIVIGDLTLP